MDREKDKVLLDNCMGGGKIICDGEHHWMYRSEFEKLQCEEYQSLGPCPGEKHCRPIVAKAMPPMPKRR